MWLASVLVALASCGRAGFDIIIATDAAPGSDATVDDAADPLLAGCALHLAVDEPLWTGAVGEISTRCLPHPGTAVGGARVVDDSVRGRVAELVGGTSCIEFGSPGTLEAFDQLTLAAWLFPTHADISPHGIVAKRVAFEVASQFALFIDDGDLAYVDINNATDRFATTSPTTVNVWQQLTVVFDGRNTQGVRVRVYRNGALDKVASDSEDQIAPLDSPFVIGCLPDGPAAQSFMGRLDDVVMWTRALSDGEVMAWYTRTRL